MDFQTIEQIIAEPMADFRKTFRGLIASPVEVIQKITDQLNNTQGKQLRPMLMLLSDAATEGRNPRVAQLATAMELLHNATLIHDDVVDESELRRGRPSVNKTWGNKVAVLCGDYYLAQVMMLLNQYDDSAVTTIVNQTVIDLSEGELMQQGSSHRKDTSMAHYMNVIYKKTAALIAACCELGAIHTPHRELMREFGRLYGLAFQMRDDLLDYHSTEETGKPSGNDIKEKKMTLPLLCFLEQATDKQSRRVMEILDHEVVSDEDTAEVAEMVRQSDALETAYRLMNIQLDQAVEQCNQLPETPYKKALMGLCDYLR